MTRPLRFLVVTVLLASSGAVLPGQTPATGAVMRAKLEHSQKILESIMTSDFAMLERHSADLSRATTAPGWAVLNSPEYLRQSANFLGATQDLVRAAKGRDLDAAAMGYVSMTLSCYQCHRYIKGMRKTM